MKRMRFFIGLFCLIPALCGAQNGVAAAMVLVEWGSFQMGSEKGDKDEKPVHKVTLRSFLMSKYEVTQWEWNQVMEENPSSFTGDTLPVENVTWYEAIQFCNELSRRENLTPAYRATKNIIYCNFNADGYRLPTEAEWEYAAKGGKKDYLVFTYSGGDNVNEVAWFYNNSEGKTHPVGTKLPNDLGLYDMSGNVWEWCWDWYGSYESKNQANPKGPGGKTRVKRGGGYYFGPRFLRTTSRAGENPHNRNRYLGFRVCRSII